MITEPNNSPEPGSAPAIKAGPTNVAEPGLATLLGGVVADVQKLMGQHLKMFQQEVREDFRRTKEAALFVAWAAGLGAAGGGLLLAMLVGLLAWAVPAVPWWGWCGLLGGVVVLLAAVLYGVGRQKFASFSPLPDESVAAIKASADWIADRMTSDRK
jgi:hypothetical protein